MEVNFLVSLHYLEIQGNLGRGDRIDDTTFLSNDIDNLKKILPSASANIIGLLEYNSLLDSKAYIYSIEQLPKDTNPEDFLRYKLYSAQAFLSTIWFYEDNNVDFEIGFLFYRSGLRLSVSSNYLATAHTISSGKREVFKLTRDKLKSIREFYRHNFTSDELSFGYRYPTQLLKGNTRIESALYHIAGARCNLDIGLKISNYCSALEALFSTNQAELAHQLSERLAFFIGTSSEEKLSIYKKAKQAYTIRSKIVHGTTIKESDIAKITELSKFCDLSLREAMNKILSNPDIREMIEGSPENLDSFMLNLIFGISE